MKKNLILTAAVGLDASQIKLFVKTLRKYYRDEICVIIGQKDQRQNGTNTMKIYMTRFGIETVVNVSIAEAIKI